jgi:myosin heavy subunit
MNHQDNKESTIDWIPLKDAALLLGCSVKTIRRRIKAGTWRSMIEYQGQKAIRLVARQDILKETSIQKQPYFTSIDSNLAVHALEDVHHQLDRTLGTNLDQFNRKFSAAVFGSRIYLIVALIITAIFIIGFMVLFSDSREEVIEGRMVDMKDELSTIIADSREASSRAANQATRQYEKALAITDDSNKEIKATREEIKGLSSVLESAQKQAIDSRQEVKNTRDEVTALRRELAELREEINSLREISPEETEPAVDQTIPPAEEVKEELQSPTPIPSPPPPEEKEEESSGFLGIF